MVELTSTTARPDERPRLSGDHPSKLFVELTTRCNLRCGMCVKQTAEGGIREGAMSPEVFESLMPAFPHLTTLVLNGIGESLLHPSLEDYVRKARQLLPDAAWVGFQTNGMLLDEGRATSLVQAGVDRISISLDAVTAEGFRSIREGGEVEKVESAFRALKKAGSIHRSRDFRAGIEFVLMRENMGELPSVIRWAGSRGARFAIVTQMLPYDRALVGQAAYDTNTADAIRIFRRWKARAMAEGVDIGRYIEVFMKFSKTEEDQKVIGFIERMKEDAKSEGVALHLERLFQRDEEWFARVERVFEEARRIARDEGMDLTLPGTEPKNSRHCEFVEGDCAFVSWDGDVHPCYFLWHRYSCHIGGWHKNVRPWALGNLREEDIQRIWDSEGYRSFRQNVLSYRFPFCYDCSFTLCDYVREEDFEQDCYVESVPCGACLWCTGLFHCLQ